VHDTVARDPLLVGSQPDGVTHDSSR